MGCKFVPSPLATDLVISLENRPVEQRYENSFQEKNSGPAFSKSAKKYKLRFIFLIKNNYFEQTRDTLNLYTNTDMIITPKIKYDVQKIHTGCPKKTWEFSDEFDIVFVMN